jgi:DnaK suppressor protein
MIIISGGEMNVTELTELELQNLKDSLLFQKSTILNKTNEFKSAQSGMTSVSDESEAVTQDIANNISIHLHERDRSALYAIERALSKISDGTYQQCESCGEVIGARRLQARPFTALCIDCMEELENHTGFLQ